MELPIAIHKDEGSIFGVTVPDVPGCFSAGETMDEAIENAREAIYAHLAFLAENGQDASVNPRPMTEHLSNPDYADAVWKSVSLNLSALDLRAHALTSARAASS